MSFKNYFVALLFCAAAWAQGGAAELEIVVRDPAGLAVYGSSVRAVEEAKGREYKGLTDEDGAFRLLGLTPGNYRIEAVFGDLEPNVRTVRLQTGTRISVEIQLQLRGQNELLEVRAEKPLLETGRGSVSTVVDETLVEGLPLDGRNFVPLIATLPGVALPRGSAFPRLNGSRPRTNEYIYDGVSVLQPEPGQVAYFPIIDAIEEFRVDLNSYSAEYGRSNGGVVQVRHKSGSNEFHGRLFEFFRHEKLNARNVFAVSGTKPLFRRNQFGFVIGGPVVRNRTFFFGEYQGSRLRTGRSPISVIPTAAQRAGDFSASAARIHDTTGDAFLNNIVPASRIDSVAAAVVARYPQANRSGANNYQRQQSEVQDSDQFGLRLDHSFNQRQQLFGRWARVNDLTTPVSPLPDGSGRITSGPIGRSGTNADVFVAEHAWTVSPNFFHQLRFGHSRRSFQSAMLRTGRSPFEELGLPGLPANSFADVLPTFAVDGFQQIGPTSNANADLETSVTEIVDTLSSIRGSHSLKLGADIRLQRMNVLQPGDPTGLFRFTAPLTGNALASLLLGLPESYQADVQQEVIQPRARNYEFFLQDDWKATPNLTLNLGLRYTLNAPSTEKQDRASIFDLDSEQLIYLGQNGESRSAREMHWGNFGPRFGFAWRAHDRLAIRGGYGLAWFEMAGITTPFTTPFFPFIQTLGESSLDNRTAAFQLADGPSVEPAAAEPNAGLGQGVFSVDRQAGSGYSQQWNLTVQRTWGSSTSFEVGYVGSKVTSLGVPDGNLNQLTATQLAQGATLLENVPNPFLGEIPASSSLGRATVTRAQLLKPWPRFTGVTLYRNNIGHSVYHGLQTSLSRSLDAGLTFRVGYTFSKLIDDASSVFSASALTGPVADYPLADSYNRRLERDVSRGDIPHVFAASFVWEIGSWRLGGIARVQSGVPIPVEQQPNLNSFAGFGSQRPHRLADPTLPAEERSTSRYFNTSAFGLAPQFTLGDSSRHPVRGPGWRTVDLMLGRDLALREDVALEFRAQVFNVTNTPPWGEPNGLFGTSAFGSITSAGDPRVFEFATKLRF